MAGLLIRRIPDGGNAPKNPRDYGKPSNAQGVQPLREIAADEVDRGVDQTREAHHPSA